MSSESDLEDDGKHVNFFMLTKDEQSLFANPVISLPRFEIHAPVHRRQLQDIAWQADFEGDLGILEYTRLFVRTQEKELVVVTRRGVERSWGEKVKERFGDDEDKKEVFRGQVNCSLINDCWARDDFEIKTNDFSMIENPNGVRDATALRVLRFPRIVSGQLSTIMIPHDTEVKSDMFSPENLKTGGVVVLPFLGLQVLKNLNYLDVAEKVRRADEKPLDEGLMKAVWRGLILNMFYFEDEDLKMEKVAEEAWESVQQPTTEVGDSASRKRKIEETGSPVESGEEHRVRKL